MNMKNLQINLKNACQNLDTISNDFKTLQTLNSRVLMKEPVVKTYRELKYFFKNWKKVLHQQNETVKHEIKDFFKFISKEFLDLEK